MSTSTMLKIESSDGSGAFIHYLSQLILPPSIPSNTSFIDESDIIIANLFYDFFATSPSNTGIVENTYLDNSMVMKSKTRAALNNSTRQPYDSLSMGYYQSSSTNVGHSDTVSMVCFTEDTLKKSYLEDLQDIGLSTDDLARLEAASIENVVDIMKDIGFGFQADPEFIKNPKLTITRCTPQDFVVVANDYFGTPETPFFDAFDLVKERLTRQESSLNSTGYAPAVYTDNGGDGSNDTIVFTGGYAVGLNFPEPVVTDPT